MSIGILGAGQIGLAFARALARQRIEATIANSRGPESLKDLVRDLPTISAGTREQAASKDLVLVAITWPKLRAALADVNLAGRIVLDANNSVAVPPAQPFDLEGRTSTEIFAELVPGARVVKAFNHLQAALLEREPTAEGGRRVLFLSGDDAAAKAEVSKLIERLGFFPLDLGALAVGAKLAQFPGGPLPGHDFVKFG